MGCVLMRIEVFVKYYEIAMVPGWHFRFATCVTSIGKWHYKANCMFCYCRSMAMEKQEELA
jgi:hypothetical protein